MATKFYYLRGKASWANRLSVPDPEYKCWSVQLTLDDDSRKIYKESKMKSKFNDSPYGPYAVVLRRPTDKEFKGVVNTFTPPIVVDADGNPMDPRTIGNGSDIIAKVMTYDYEYAGKKGIGSRLEGVQVLNHIPYEPKEIEVHGVEPPTPF